MSWYSATVHAYDVMDRVQITVTMRATIEDRSEAIETLFHTATTVPSTGERDPREWLRDALVAALEAS
jgi:hypothetical protein